MAIRDALLHNRTGSNFEALQSGDTARIRGDFLLKDVSENDVLSIDVSAGTVNITGNITSSMNISGSITSTGSFGKLVGDDYFGDGAAIRDTLPRSSGLITSSAQLAPAISGAFNAGFTTTGDISGSATSTGSFGLVFADVYSGDASQMTNVPITTNTLSSSAQIASNISGSFTSGFDLSAYSSISGSATSTASFGRVVFNDSITTTDASSKYSGQNFISCPLYESHS